MYKIGMIGDRASAAGFMALGFSVHETTDPADAAKALHAWAADGEHAVIFITEELAGTIEEDLARYKDAPLPAVTVIPGSRGGTGEGMNAIRRAVERAVGADILFAE